MGKNNLIFGIHPLIEALEAGREIDKILLKRGLRSSEVSHIMDVVKERTIPVQIVPEERLTRLTRKQHQGVIAFISEIEYTSAGSRSSRCSTRRTALPSLSCLDGYRCA